MKHIQIIITLLCATLVLSTLSSCHYPNRSERHYTINYNFIVTGDTLTLRREKPMHQQEYAPVSDSTRVYPDDRIVVAQIVVIPEDTVDSVWVKVARDQYTMGWIHENVLLENVVPADPISQFIYLFSRKHLGYFLALITIVVLFVVARYLRRERFPFVYMQDIDSPYPKALCLIMAASALLYASIQEYIPETWVEYYFHPTLNPFGQPLIMAGFICSIWLMVIVAIATADEIVHLLSGREMMLYGISLLGVCMALYLVFTLLPLPWVGYTAFGVYLIWTIYEGKNYLRL